MRLEVTIPGPPVAQGRGKVGRWRSKDGREGVTVRDPTKSRNWKATAQARMEAALMVDTPVDEVKALGLAQCNLTPLRLTIEAVFPCPTSDYRKREPMPRRRACGSRNDCDNLAKAVMDAGNGVLWLDDGQIAVLHVEKWIGAQGEAPYVRLVVEDLAPQEPKPAGNEKWALLTNRSTGDLEIWGGVSFLGLYETSAEDKGAVGFLLELLADANRGRG